MPQLQTDSTCPSGGGADTELGSQISCCHEPRVSSWVSLPTGGLSARWGSRGSILAIRGCQEGGQGGGHFSPELHIPVSGGAATEEFPELLSTVSYSKSESLNSAQFKTSLAL